MSTNLVASSVVPPVCMVERLKMPDANVEGISEISEVPEGR